MDTGSRVNSAVYCTSISGRPRVRMGTNTIESSCIRPVHGIETPVDLHRVCAGVLRINRSPRARFPTEGAGTTRRSRFSVRPLATLLDYRCVPPFVMINRACSPMRALDIEHRYQCNTPRPSCPITNCLLFRVCRGRNLLVASLPQKLTLLKYLVVMTGQGLNSYDLIRCFCFRTLASGTLASTS